MVTFSDHLHITLGHILRFCAITTISFLKRKMPLSSVFPSRLDVIIMCKGPLITSMPPLWGSCPNVLSVLHAFCFNKGGEQHPFKACSAALQKLCLVAAWWRPTTRRRLDPGNSSLYWAVGADLTHPTTTSSFCPSSRWWRWQRCDYWTLSEPCDLLLWIWESAYIESTLIKVIQTVSCIHDTASMYLQLNGCFLWVQTQRENCLRISLGFVFLGIWIVLQFRHICGPSVTSSIWSVLFVSTGKKDQETGSEAVVSSENCRVQCPALKTPLTKSDMGI